MDLQTEIRGLPHPVTKSTLERKGDLTILPFWRLRRAECICPPRALSGAHLMFSVA